MKLKLVEKKDINKDIKTFVFEPQESFTWLPGQYLHYFLAHPQPDDRGTERWFTISNPPYDGRPSITTRFTQHSGSTFKQALKNLELGNEIEADGPKGKFVVNDPAKQSVFIAGGIGITPFRSILLQLAHDKQLINVVLMYANRDDDFVFGDELEKIASNNPDFKIHKFVSPKKIEEDNIKTLASQLDNPDYYISGPKPMVTAYADMLKRMAIAEEKIYTDDFPGYEVI